MDDAPRVRSGTLVKLLYSADRARRLLIVQRSDGKFQMWEEWRSEDDGVSSWSTPMHPLRGLYDSAETAETEARTWPVYRGGSSG